MCWTNVVANLLGHGYDLFIKVLILHTIVLLFSGSCLVVLDGVLSWPGCAHKWNDIVVLFHFDPLISLWCHPNNVDIGNYNIKWCKVSILIYVPIESLSKESNNHIGNRLNKTINNCKLTTIENITNE